ncbi:MAG: hypothetical protein J7K40_13575 [candidate division Zixibacteria bacterium]|nr:hypothetical protein [candidate division Zixibacteria bacterium]
MQVRAIILYCVIWLFIGMASMLAAGPSSLVFDYSQNNNTYNWENSFKRHFDFGRLNCDLDVNTNSTLLKNQYKRWQEHLWTTFRADYRIIKGLSLAPYMYHSRSALQERIVYTSEIKLSMPFAKIKYLNINPFIANRAIKRIGDEPSGIDKGLGYGAAANSKPLKVLGNSIESMVSYHYYDLSRIPYSEFNARLGGLIIWSKADTIQWNLRNLESAKRYYSKPSKTSNKEAAVYEVVRQVKVDRGADYYFAVALPGDIVSRMIGGLDYISYKYNYNQEAILLSQTDNYTQNRNFNLMLERIFFNKIKVITGYRYNWGEEDYGRKQLDQWLEMGELSLKASAEISLDDSVFFDGIVGVTSYFKLNQSSIFERDLKTQIYNFRCKHTFNRYFSGEARVGYSNFYQIYTSGLNSANNNQNETYLLRSTFDWSLASYFNIVQSFEIRANYIIFDYIPNPLETPSRIFRRGASETGFRLSLSDRFVVSPTYIYRYEDYGKLIWEESNWQQATGWDRNYHNLNIKISYCPFSKICIEPEYSWESKKEYNHKLGSEIIFDNKQIVREIKLDDFKQIAAVNITWQFSPNEYLTAGYSRRKWEYLGQETDITEFVNVSVRYTF